ncbi:hypothetical protein JW998_11180 [candidate division KSB1 bacterium]|nr:hypothetical protein [candidate division KSB1 bacterium]
MNNKTNRIIGGLIVLTGVVALLVNTNVLHGLEELVGGVLLLAGALFFFSLYHKDRSRWWPLLPGAILAVLGIGVICENYVPVAADLLGAGVMYTIFAVFAFISARNRASWWAVIPAGICFTLGTVALVDSFNWLDSELNGVIFFLGLGLTFLYLWSLRNEVAAVSWAIWPAGVLLAVGTLVYVNEVDWLRDEFIFPFIIIVIGVIIIVNGARKKK